MTSIADMVERMAAEGLSIGAIVAALRVFESVTVHHGPVTSPSRHASRDATKEKANERARRYRLNLKNQRLAKANDVAAESVTVTPKTVTHHVTEPNDAILTSFLSTSSGKPLKEVRGRENARARGTRLSPGAPLSDEHRAIIIGEGVTDPEKLWAEFVDYWSDIPGQRGCKISWSGTLRNRCRMVKTNTNGAKNGRRTVHQAADDLLAKIQAFDEPAPSELCSPTGQTPIRLLPSR